MCLYCSWRVIFLRDRRLRVFWERVLVTDCCHYPHKMRHRAQYWYSYRFYKSLKTRVSSYSRGVKDPTTPGGHRRRLYSYGLLRPHFPRHVPHDDRPIGPSTRDEDVTQGPRDGTLPRMGSWCRGSLSDGPPQFPSTTVFSRGLQKQTEEHPVENVDGPQPTRGVLTEPS